MRVFIEADAAQISDAVVLAMNAEPMQRFPAPVQGNLNVWMELSGGGLTGDQQAPPDHRGGNAAVEIPDTPIRAPAPRRVPPDYRKALRTVFTELSATDASERLERLIGVALKAPFAEPEGLPVPSRYSHAYRGWNLDEKLFASPNASSTWQYRTLEGLWRVPENAGRFPTVLDLARDAHFERGFLGYLTRSLQKYICGDPEIRKAIDKSIREGKAAGFDVKLLTPQQLVQGGGLALGSYLVVHIPLLGFVGTPVIAGLVLLLYTIGVDAFCAWVKDNAMIERA
jgi:hypothetical protein